MLCEQIEEEVVVEEPKKAKVGRKPTRGTEYKEKVKSFKFRLRSNTALYEIYLEDGGLIPEVLKGLYTSTVTCQKAIKLYESNRRQYY